MGHLTKVQTLYAKVAPNENAPARPKPSLHASSESAALSIGRLDAQIAGHPLRAAWEHRQRLLATVEACGWDGVGIDRARLTARLIGAPVKPLRGHPGHGLDEHRALVFLNTLVGLCDTTVLPCPALLPASEDGAILAEMHEGIGLFLDAVDSSRAPTTLIAIAEAAWAVRREHDASPGILHAALPAALFNRGFTRSGFLPGLAAFPPRKADRAEWMGLFLDGLAKAADDALSRLGGLVLTCTDWQRRIGPRQKNSRLPQVVVAALCRPFMSAKSTQALFGFSGHGKNRRWNLSLPGASKLLGELVEIGVVAEETGRTGSHRLFVAREFGIGSAVQRRDEDKPPSPARIPHPRALVGSIGARALDEAMGEADEALRRSDAALMRLGIVRRTREEEETDGDDLPPPPDEDPIEPLDFDEGRRAFP